MTIPIGSPLLQAEIAAQGAQLSRLRDGGGKDLQWGGDPAVWKGRAPILFPIVGALANGHYRVDGAGYALPRHGFARDMLFAVEEATAARARFRLDWNQETLRLYPFRFSLGLEYRVAGARLDMVATVTNLEAAKLLPASFGFHPALAWPLPFGCPRAEHRIVFEAAETAPVRRLDAQGLLLPQGFPTPVRGRVLELRDDLFAADALIFDALISRRLTYGAPQGPRLEVEFPDAPRLGLWSKPGADFLCIEPWNGVADPVGFDGDFRDKPGISLVAPGHSRTFSMAITLLP